jgi:hypothetical protein
MGETLPCSNHLAIGLGSRYKRPMARPSKRNLLLDVAAISMVVCRRHLVAYSCPKSKHDFTQTQLMTCLVLRGYLKQSYRGIVDVLDASDDLRGALGLSKVPAHTTLKEFEKRVVTPELLDAIIARVLELCRENGDTQIQEVAADSTGVECSPASVHYADRSGKKRGRYVKLSLAVACGSLLLVGAVASAGPSNDRVEAPSRLWRIASRCQPHSIYMDSGYDGERTHAFCRAGWGVSSFIPPVPRTRDGSVKSFYRSQCVVLPASYGRRWHVETFISGFKRSTGSVLSSRSMPAMQNEAMLKLLAYAIRR